MVETVRYMFVCRMRTCLERNHHDRPACAIPDNIPDARRQCHWRSLRSNNRACRSHAHEPPPARLRVAIGGVSAPIPLHAGHLEAARARMCAYSLTRRRPLCAPDRTAVAAPNDCSDRQCLPGPPSCPVASASQQCRSHTKRRSGRQDVRAFVMQGATINMHQQACRGR